MKYLLPLFLLILPSLLLGQAAEEELLPLLPPSFTTSGPVGTTEIHQDGIDHQAIAQTQDGYVRVQQRGEAHVLQATQQGTDGQWLIQQHGTGHRYTGSAVGDRNRIEVSQRGEGNLIQQDLVGSDMRYRLTQEGQGHELIQIEHDPLAPAYEVHQRGPGMQITIEQGFVGLPPLEP